MVFHRGQSLVLLLAIYIFCDLFYFLEGVAVASYADDFTPYSANKTNDLVIKELELIVEKLVYHVSANFHI